MYLPQYKVILTWLTGVILVLSVLVSNALAESYALNIRTSDKQEFSRFVIDLSAEPNYKTFMLSSPERLVLDIKNTVWTNDLSPPQDSSLIKEIRHSQRGKDLRIVFDLSVKSTIKNQFILSPYGNQYHRLVVDITAQQQKATSLAPKPIRKDGRQIIAPTPKTKKQRKPIIIIDAGHGGRDPGTIGRKKTKEKNITLKYATSLHKILAKRSSYRVKLTRSTDKFIPLRERVRRAHDAKADLFISLHADAHKNPKTQGLSVYTLSETASDKEAAALARKENKEDFFPNSNIEFDDYSVTNLLIDLVQRDTKNLSSSFAEELVKNLSRKVKVLRNPHRFAGFRVLTSPEVPSVLIELGYLSNRKEEKLLSNSRHRKKIIDAIAKSVDNHFAKFQIN